MTVLCQGVEHHSRQVLVSLRVIPFSQERPDEGDRFFQPPVYFRGIRVPDGEAQVHPMRAGQVRQRCRSYSILHPLQDLGESGF